MAPRMWERACAAETSTAQTQAGVEDGAVAAHSRSSERGQTLTPDAIGKWKGACRRWPPPAANSTAGLRAVEDKESVRGLKVDGARLPLLPIETGLLDGDIELLPLGGLLEDPPTMRHGAENSTMDRSVHVDVFCFPFSVGSWAWLGCQPFVLSGGPFWFAGVSVIPRLGGGRRASPLWPATGWLSRCFRSFALGGGRVTWSWRQTGSSFAFQRPRQLRLLFLFRSLAARLDLLFLFCACVSASPRLRRVGSGRLLVAGCLQPCAAGFGDLFRPRKAVDSEPDVQREAHACLVATSSFSVTPQDKLFFYLHPPSASRTQPRLLLSEGFLDGCNDQIWLQPCISGSSAACNVSSSQGR
ncbi:hypothetical protein BRADI_2g56422v3 [Brachypodium distachyon]|uniref:Uncharacterized protein n=1 Tax=Brachypodium distachyon TaxID=15368 RepID=A0A0Q3GI73_BRADI|nr:hypothetical protein BRADI_2g56422v3 [Brachypodium distachyon]